jgi:hypothetical protein
MIAAGLKSGRWLKLLSTSGADFRHTSEDYGSPAFCCGDQNQVRARWLIAKERCGNTLCIGQGKKSCGGCEKRVYYCSKACQRIHWKKEHHTNCGENYVVPTFLRRGNRPPIAHLVSYNASGGIIKRKY